MQHVARQSLSLETKYVGIEFRILKTVFCRMVSFVVLGGCEYILFLSMCVVLGRLESDLVGRSWFALVGQASRDHDAMSLGRPIERFVQFSFS